MNTDEKIRFKKLIEQVSEVLKDYVKYPGTAVGLIRDLIEAKYKEDLQEEKRQREEKDRKHQEANDTVITFFLQEIRKEFQLELSTFPMTRKHHQHTPRVVVSSPVFLTQESGYYYDGEEQVRNCTIDILLVHPFFKINMDAKFTVYTEHWTGRSDMGYERWYIEQENELKESNCVIDFFGDTTFLVRCCLGDANNKVWDDWKFIPIQDVFTLVENEYEIAPTALTEWEMFAKNIIDIMFERSEKHDTLNQILNEAANKAIEFCYRTHLNLTDCFDFNTAPEMQHTEILAITL